MSSPDNILLHLAQEDEDTVREVFAELHRRGFPEQRQRPHVTVTFSPAMHPDATQLAGQLLPEVVPATLTRVGTVIFGIKRKQTVAWLLDAPDDLSAAARDISAANPDGRGHTWTPHLTVGLRLPREIIPDYLRALDELTPRSFRELRAVRAGLWQPRREIYASLAD